MFANYLVGNNNNGKNTFKAMNTRIVRRIRFDKQQLDTVAKLRIASLDAFTRLAVYEKLERDFNQKAKVPF